MGLRAARTTQLLVALACLGGCADFDTLEEDVCGNRVVEPEAGEDCDGGATCIDAKLPGECRFACDPAIRMRDGFDANAGCPAGYGCGIDGVCRQPTGELTATYTADTPFIIALSFADLAGDGRRELVRTTFLDTFVDVYQEGGSLRTATSLPRDATRPVATDIDADGRDDLLSALGVAGAASMSVYRTREDLGLVPTAFATVPFGQLGDAKTVSANVVSPDTMDELVMFADTFAVVLLDGVFEYATLAADQPPAGTQVRPMSGRFRVGPVADDCDDVVYGVQGGDAVRVMTPCNGDAPADGDASWQEIRLLDGGRLPSFDDEDRPSAAVNLSRVLFAIDFNQDSFLDIAIAAQNNAGPGLWVAYGAGDGSYRSDPLGPEDSRAAHVSLDSVTPNDPECAFVTSFPLTLVEDTDLDGDPDIGTAVGAMQASADADMDGVPEYVCGGFTGGDDPAQFSFALAVDLNANGTKDFVLGTPDLTNLLLLQTLSDGTFATASIPLPRPALWIETGDFDADTVNDIALVLADNAFGNDNPAGARNELMIAYGRPFGLPEEPASLGTLDSVIAFAAGRLLSNDGASDLVALSRAPDEGGVHSGFIVGDARRQLLSPYVFERDGEVVSLEAHTPIRVADSEESAHVVAMAGGDTGFVLAFEAGRVAMQFSAVGSCLDCQIAALDLDGDGSDEVVTFQDDVVASYRVGVSGLELISAVTTPYTYRSARALVMVKAEESAAGAVQPVVRDLDADGLADVIAFSTDGELVVMFNDGAGAFPGQMTVAGIDPFNTGAVAALNLDADPELELVTLTAATLVQRLQLDVPSRMFGEIEPLVVIRDGKPTNQSSISLASDDIDGDGVEDLVVTSLDLFGLIKGGAR